LSAIAVLLFMIEKCDFQNRLPFYCFFLYPQLNAKIKLNQQKSNA